MNERVLVVDDEQDVRSLVRALLEDRGFAVDEAANGAEGLRVLYAERPDVVVLDLGMTGMDGWQALTRIRELSDELPVLILSSRAGDLEKVRGLRAGADDYLVKPFFGEELVARVEALLRRTARQHLRESYDDGALTIDYLEHRVRAGDTDLSLTPLEFRLLCEFVAHPRQVLSHEQLLERVWHDPIAVAPDQVRLYVGYLRRKLGAARDRIETVRGFGYRYVPPAAQAGDTPTNAI